MIILGKPKLLTLLLASAAAIGGASPVLAAVADAAGGPVDELVVTARYANAPSAVGTPQEARKEQQDAPNIVNVRPQSEIEKIPDFTVAEAARRLPGVSIQSFSNEGRLISVRGLDPSLNGVTYEGVPIPAGSSDSAGRAVPLDTIPSPLIGGIELVKSNRPDMDATALGGSVNIVTRQVTADGRPLAELIGGGGYESLHGQALYEGTFVGGLRFGLKSNPFQAPLVGDDKPFSLVVVATHNEDWRFYDDVEPAYIDKAGIPQNALSGLDLRRYEQHRTRYGYGLNFGWDVDAQTTLYLKASYSGYEETQNRQRLVYGGLSSGLSYSAATLGVYDSNSTTQQQIRDSDSNFRTTFVKFGGGTAFDRMRLDYYGSYAGNQAYKPTDYNETFTNSVAIPVEVNNGADPSLPSVRVTNSANPLNYGTYKLSSVSNSQTYDNDTEWDGAVALTAPGDFGGWKGDFKIGGGVRLRTKTMWDPAETYTGLPAIYAGQVAGTQSKSIYNDAYQLGVTANPNALVSLINSATLVENLAADTLSNAQTLVRDNENVYAGFGQYSGSYGKLGVLAGVRFEQTNGVYRGNATSTPAAGPAVVTPNVVTQSYFNAFPTVQFRYAFSDTLIGRAVYSTAIGRPTFTQLSPATVVSIGAGTVTTGNPSIRPTTANSFDLSVEDYLPFGGIASAGLFDKEFTNYIAAQTVSEAYPGITGVAQVSTFMNLPYARARGVELNYQQQFTQLSGAFAGLGMNANYTYTDSAGTSRAGVHETLPYTSTQTFNVGQSYVHGPIDIQITETYAGLTLRTLGKTPAGDVYLQPYFQLDLGARYHITPRFAVYFQARNLNAEKFQTTETSNPARLTGQQLYGPTYLLGFDLKL